MMGQGNGVVNGVMGGMNNALNSVTNGNVSKLDLLGLITSAYMMFGRFGWLGKAASLMLGGMTLKISIIINKYKFHHSKVTNK